MPEIERKTDPPPSKKNGNMMLLSVALTLAVTIPTTINSIPNPVVRAAFALVGLIVIFGVGYRMTPKGK